MKTYVVGTLVCTHSICAQKNKKISVFLSGKISYLDYWAQMLFRAVLTELTCRKIIAEDNLISFYFFAFQGL